MSQTAREQTESLLGFAWRLPPPFLASTGGEAIKPNGGCQAGWLCRNSYRPPGNARRNYWPKKLLGRGLDQFDAGRRSEMEGRVGNRWIDFFALEGVLEHRVVLVLHDQAVDDKIGSGEEGDLGVGHLVGLGQRREK